MMRQRGSLGFLTGHGNRCSYCENDSSLLAWIIWKREPPSTSSRTMPGVGSSMPKHRTMQGWFTAVILPTWGMMGF